MGEIKIKDSWDNFLNFVKDNGKGSEVSLIENHVHIFTLNDAILL